MSEVMDDVPWHHPPEQLGKTDETSRIFCGHVNFPEMDGVISVYGATKSNNHKVGGGYLSLIILFKNKNIK